MVECVIPLPDELIRKEIGQPTATKHGDHDQSEHGNWATGETTGTGTKEDPIRTSDVEAAARALGEGKHVKLDSPDQVSTLLDRLNELAKEAEASGGKAKNIDLCNVSVPGTNLFCVESKGIPRIDMPQLKGVPTDGSPASQLTVDARGEVDITEKFLDDLRARGIGLEPGEALASHLKATQNELNGNKVAGIMGAMRDGKLDVTSPMVVSKDGYIVDGHHRWAAAVALEYDGIDNPVTDMAMKVVRVDADIIDILEASKAFAAEQGIPQIAVKRFIVVRSRKHGDHDQSEHGAWATGGGGESSSSTQPMTANEAAIALTEKFGGATMPVEITMDEWAEYEKSIIDGPQPTTGYAVATAVPGTQVAAADFMDRERGVAAIEKFLTDNVDHFADPKNHLGVWNNQENGMVYLDVTEVVDSKEEAVRLGAERNQISVWDFENSEEIQTGGTGESTSKARTVEHSDARHLKVVARANPTTRRIAVFRSGSK